MCLWNFIKLNGEKGLENPSAWCDLKAQISFIADVSMMIRSKDDQQIII